MKKNTCYVAGLLMAGAFFTACKKDSGSSSTTTPVSAKTVTNVNADPSATGNHYTFFLPRKKRSRRVSHCATMRASTSVVPAGGYGTIHFTGRTG